MATIEDLRDGRRLLPYRAALEPSEMPERLVSFAPEFDLWLINCLSPIGVLHGRDVTPYEQADQILYEFVVGRPLAYSVHYRKLDPVQAHTWELKTPDVRLFGWFPRRAHIVLVCGALKDSVRKFKDYEPFVNTVTAFRANLDLDEPKALTGVNRNDVL